MQDHVMVSGKIDLGKGIGSSEALSGIYSCISHVFKAHCENLKW